MLINFIILLILIMFLFLDKSCDKQENFSCPIGQSCCLQGWYGNYPNCVQCPSNKPSSPRTDSGGPDSKCNCPNATESSCFACTNVCKPFNPATGICTPICSACRVVTINGVKIPANCDETEIKSAVELKNAGFKLTELITFGFTASDLRRAGFTNLELYNAGLQPCPNVCYTFNPTTGKCTKICPSCTVREVNDKHVPHCT